MATESGPARALRLLMRSVRRRVTNSHRRGGGVVLAYHRVIEAPHDDGCTAVSPRHFAEHLEVIRARGVPMPLHELVERAERDDLPPRAVAVTIDDGYHDAATAAAPLLRRASIPATVFVCAAFVDRGAAFPWDRRDAGDDAPRPSHRPLTREELIGLSRCDGITIGSHTHTHPVLSALPQCEQQREIARGRDWLEAALGTPVTDFAYPFGGRSQVSRDSIRAARAAGVSIACSTVGGTVHRGIDRLFVPRITVGNWPGDEFARRWLEWQ